MFPNLLAAVFVILVKVMSAVRITSDSKKLNIKLPTNDVFVHSCYIAVAKSLYDDPYLMVDDISEMERVAAIRTRISKAIHEVVEDFVPVQQILDTYIPSCLGNELDMGGQQEVEPTPEAEPEPEPEAAPEGAEPASALENAVEEAVTPSDTPPEGEVKTVPVEGAPPPAPAPVHQETLFDDAPEKK